MALNYGLYAMTQVVGPGLGGILIGAFGVQAAYTVDAVSCLAMVLAVLPIGPQPGAARRATPRERPPLDRRRPALRAR